MKRTLCILAFISLCSFTVDDPLMALLKRLEEFTRKYPAEKVYLHLDKPYYAAGDDIWFKAYVTDWKTGLLSPMSAVIYVELINQSDKIEKKIKLPMQNGITWGDFKLTDTLKEGNYRIRAYTQWMRNAGPEFFFDKTIKIGNSWTNKVFTKTQYKALNQDSTRAVISFADEKNKPIVDKIIEFSVGPLKGREKTNSQGEIGFNFPSAKGNIDVKLSTELRKVEKIIPIKLPNSTIDIQFLPEGGNLIEGIKSKIAVKSIGTNGLGLKANGKIFDQTGAQLADFETSELGMGSFYLIPEPGKTYSAKLSDRSIALPKAESSGYAIAFKAIDSTKFTATVRISQDLLNKGDLNLVAQRNGLAFSSSKLSPTTRTVEIIYENKDFPQGIIQFTLFSPSNNPVCERLFFVNNKANDISIDLPSLKSSYAKKEKVDLDLLTTVNAKPSRASLSVSVTNMDAVTPDLANESHIKANVLLTSDLIGYVEKPNDYFLDNDAKTVEALDHLMLTQGWRKIDWKMPEPVIKYEPDRGLSISGVISKDNLPLSKSKVSLMTNASGMFVIDTLSNEKGEFIFEDLEFLDPTKFVIQARTEKDQKNVKIAVNLSTEQELTQSPYAKDLDVNVNGSIENYLKASKNYFEEMNRQGLLTKTIFLKEVKIEGGRTNLAPNSLNLNGPGNADQIIDLTQLQVADRVDKYLQGRVSGIAIDGTGLATSRRTYSDKGIVVGLPVNARAKPTAEPKYARIILDGRDMGDSFTLADLDAQTIESIEVLTSTPKLAVYGPQAQAGLFIITSKRGNASADVVKYAPGVTTFVPKGYYAARTFYSPRYDVEPSSKPDLRTTIHWFPNLVTDEAGKIKFDYFNTDQAGNYRMVIEGIDLNGNLARKTYTYKVN